VACPLARGAQLWPSVEPLRDAGLQLLLAYGDSVIFTAIEKEQRAMANPFVHVELNTTDVAKAKGFYGRLFGWKLEDVPMENMTYTMIGVGEGTGGGMMKQMIPGAPSFWMAYVLVDDVAAATKKAKSLGATVMKDVTPVTDMGSFSIIVDPTGAHLGLWETKKK
jgi:hypothetical protein